MDIFEKYPSSKFLKGLPDDSDFFPLRERIIELFRFLDGLEDPHFEQELDQDPHARLWEMMLAKILKSEGYEPTSATHGPDFAIERGGKKILIEGICPGTGVEGNPNSVPPIVYGASIAQDVPVAKIVLRIRSALEDKKRKYFQYLQQGIVSEDDICIIGITLIVPGWNDSDEEIQKAAEFLVSISPDIPWHVTAFHKDYKMTDPDNTPPLTLLKAARIGEAAGLRYVYAGNLPGRVWKYENTYCPTCKDPLITRFGFHVTENRLTPSGTCLSCHTKIPGIWS